MVVLNAGILLSLMRPGGLFFVGAPLMVVSMMLYLMGFPGRAFREGLDGDGVGAGAFAAGIVLLYMERVRLASGQDALSIFYGETWRHLMVSGFSVWMFGAGMMGMAAFVPERVRPRVAGMTATLLFIGGSVITGAILFAAGYSHEMLQGLIVGTVMQTFAVLVGLAGLLRCMRFVGPVTEATR